MTDEPVGGTGYPPPYPEYPAAPLVPGMGPEPDAGPGMLSGPGMSPGPGLPPLPGASGPPTVPLPPVYLDGLVVPPGAGLSDWLERVIDVIKRSWRPLLLIGLVTGVLPTFVLSLLADGATFSGHAVAGNGTLGFSGRLVGVSVGFGCLGLIVAVAAAYLAALGSAGAVWTVTQHAAGRVSGLSQALRYGRRRALPVWGWTLLAGVLVLIGLCACIVPGLYFLIATSMVVPVVVYERAPGVSRSFGLVHASFGTALVRLLLLGLAIAVLGCLGGLPAGIAQATLVNAGGAARWLGSLGAGIWQAIVTLPVFMLASAGIVVTYAELRSRQQVEAGAQPLSTAQLLAELG